MKENDRAAEPPTEAAASTARTPGAQPEGAEPTAAETRPGAGEPVSPSEAPETEELSRRATTPAAGEDDQTGPAERTTQLAAEGGPEDGATEQIEPGDRAGRGTMRFQDPDTATPRPPTLAEQRARQRAEQEEREREEAEQAEAARKAKKRKRLLIGGGVTVGVAALVAAGYAIASPDEVNATCVDQNNVAVADNDCDDAYVASHGGYNSGGIFFLPGFGQYLDYYGGSPVGIGQTVNGGTFTKPDNATIKTGSGKTIQRGGFGIKGGSSGKSGGS
jgi:hypothetical protein